MYRAKRVLPHGSPLGEERFDTQKAMELRCCLKTLVAGNCVETLRLSYTLTPTVPPQCTLFSFLEVYKKYVELPSVGNVCHKTA